MIPEVNEKDRQVIRDYLIQIERSVSAARDALNDDDAARVVERVGNIVYAARLAEACATRAVMLTKLAASPQLHEDRL